MPKSCPNPMCFFTFDRRNSPEICPKCMVLPSSSMKTNVKEKSRQKKSVPLPNPKHATVDLGGGIYSVQYH